MYISVCICVCCACVRMHLRCMWCHHTLICAPLLSLMSSTQKRACSRLLLRRYLHGVKCCWYHRGGHSCLCMCVYTYACVRVHCCFGARVELRLVDTYTPTPTPTRKHAHIHKRTHIHTDAQSKRIYTHKYTCHTHKKTGVGLQGVGCEGHWSLSMATSSTYVHI